jgi:GrpB-like predicted nucleotidyltransferase (UPF0157 family)
MISLSPYRAAWLSEFRDYGTVLRDHLGSLALRIDHIGSTSIPGLAAKDILDIQVTVETLLPEIEEAILTAGYVRLQYLADHVPPAYNPDPVQWQKWVFKSE